MLSDSSRLPSWFENRQALPRGNLRAKIYLYDTNFSDFGKVKMEIFDAENKKLAQRSGKWRWHPSSQAKLEGIGYIERPLLFIVEIDGTTDVYEQRKTDDVLRIIDVPPSNTSS